MTRSLCVLLSAVLFVAGADAATFTAASVSLQVTNGQLTDSCSDTASSRASVLVDASCELLVVGGVPWSDPTVGGWAQAYAGGAHYVQVEIQYDLFDDFSSTPQSLVGRAEAEGHDSVTIFGTPGTGTAYVELFDYGDSSIWGTWSLNGVSNQYRVAIPFTFNAPFPLDLRAAQVMNVTEGSSPFEGTGVAISIFKMEVYGPEGRLSSYRYTTESRQPYSLVGGTFVVVPEPLTSITLPLGIFMIMALGWLQRRLRRLPMHS